MNVVSALKCAMIAIDAEKSVHMLITEILVIQMTECSFGWKKTGIQMYVGINMGRWYTESNKSPYRNSNWGAIEKENQLLFPNLNTAKEFITKVS